jgi:threonine/homoserine/homoserine lactone efflux protein
MIEVDVLITFSVLILSLCFIPAPDITQVIIQSTLQGRKSGFIVVLGICSALMLNSAAVIFGIATIFRTSEFAFFVLQWIGVVYLLYLAVSSFFVESKRAVVESHGALSRWNLYRRGVLITLLNPLAMLSLLILLPPFIDEELGHIPFQMLQLCTIMTLVVFVVFSSFSIIADSVLRKWLHSKRAQHYLCYFSGVIILFFAGFLAIAQPIL